MKIGLFVYATELGCPIVDVGRLAEQYHLESVFVCEHSHVPAPPRAYLDPEGRVLPPHYSHLFDPLITLAALAGTTTSLVLGTAVCIAAQRDPITTAKEVATLDQVSMGRVEFGVGTGWSAAEARAHGVEPGRQHRALAENVSLIRALWTSDSVSLPFLADADPIATWPRPYQQPHPPVLIAGNGPRVFERVEAYGDGWLVTHRHSDLASACDALRKLRDRTGKAYPASMVAGADDPALLAHYAALGINRALLAVRPGTREQTEERIAAIAQLAAAVQDRAP